MKLKRIIFWGIICFLCLSLGIVGLIYNNRIFNQRKSELNELVNLFNETNIIKKYNSFGININAKLEDKNIIVTYNENELIYEFKGNYLEIDTPENSDIIYNITMAVADSIATYYGNNKDYVNEYFTNNQVYSFTLDDGIEFTPKDGQYKIKISLINYIGKEKVSN